MLKHTHTYTDPLTHVPCTHMLNRRLMFCQGLRLYPPSAKNKFSKDVEITFEEFTYYKWWKERQIKCSSEGQETLPFVLNFHTKVKCEWFRTFAVDWVKETLRYRRSDRFNRMEDGLHHRQRCAERGDRKMRAMVLVSCANKCLANLLMCACLQVPIKVNKTNCYITINSWCNFVSHPFLCVCGGGGCLTVFSSSPPPPSLCLGACQGQRS